MKKSVLVTGGTVRLGKCISEYLTEKGWDVFTTSHRPAAKANFPLDFRNLTIQKMEETIEMIADCLHDRPFDALVNNAALFKPTGLTTYDNDGDKIDIGLLLANNILPSLFIHELVSHGMLKKPGAVVNILDAEVLGAKEIKKSDCYLYSKRLFAQQTLDDAKRYAPNIRVNGVAPGSVFPPKGAHVKAAKRLLKSAPEGRDVAKAVAFLLENESINGTILPVDCGQVNRIERQMKLAKEQIVKGK